MTTSTRTYLRGRENVLFCCDRCGQTRRRSQISKEWTGLMVCRLTCLDPVPAEMSPPRVYPEGLPVPDARFVPPYTFATPGPIDTSDL